MKQLPAHLADYIPVKQRIAQMREENPDWSVRTTVDILDGFYLARCDIHDPDGRHLASAGALERAGKPFDYEKAETSAVGRALVFAGYIDSVELSTEELERSEGVTAARKPSTPPPTPQPVDRGPVTPQTVADQQPLRAPEQVEEAFPPTVDDLMRLKHPVQSAPKGIWADFITELVAAAAHENIAIPWLDLTRGKHFNELTTIELKHLVADVDKWLNEPEVEG